LPSCNQRVRSAVSATEFSDNLGLPAWVRLLVWTAPGGIGCARMRSVLISNRGDRPWNRLAELEWTRRSMFFSFMA